MAIPAHELRRLAAYQPLLDEAREVAEQKLGPLDWEPCRPAERTKLVDADDVYRLGPVSGFGIVVPALVPSQIEMWLDELLTRHGFEIYRPLAGSSWGALILSAKDAEGARFVITIKERVDIWVDIQAR